MGVAQFFSCALPFRFCWVKDNVLSSNKNERMDRKKKIVKHPKAANASSKIGEDEPAPQSASDIINEMKEARGQVLSQ